MPFSGGRNSIASVVSAIREDIAYSKDPTKVPANFRRTQRRRKIAQTIFLAVLMGVIYLTVSAHLHR